MGDKKLVITATHIRYIEYVVKRLVDISKNQRLAKILGKNIIDTLNTGEKYER